MQNILQCIKTAIGYNCHILLLGCNSFKKKTVQLSDKVSQHNVHITEHDKAELTNLLDFLAGEHQCLFSSL